ncbi:MAG: RNA methyltransferase [Propionibacteriaceae bacterium]|jgi:TrmH family RNA methyltransferase|nr:RNA methyltransferase [Propionibacteriaceae bacterium]
MSGDVTTAGLRLARRLLNRKFRSSAGEFLVEGPQSVAEAVEYGYATRVLATAAAAAAHPSLVAGGFDTLTPGQVKDLADTVHSAGIFAICRTRTWSVDDVIHDGTGLIVICAQIRDPGNLGTVIRCADAFGADAVVLTPGSVDPTNPKVVRASVGSIFHLPIVTSVELSVAADEARAHGMTVLAADGSGRDITELARSGQLARPVAWIMGNEAWGLPAQDRAQADQVVRIPLWGKAESLNLATAAAVCLFTTASCRHDPH